MVNADLPAEFDTKSELGTRLTVSPGIYGSSID